jgi:hypothetical protein
MHTLKSIAQLLCRILLALRYYHRLGYTWHLAWVKAAR